MVTLARPPIRSYLKITNRSFRYAAPYLWNWLPTDLREPRQIQSPSLSPITHGNSSSSSSPSSLSPLASSLTRSIFHSELKTWLFCKSFPPTGLIPRTLGQFNVSIVLNGWICCTFIHSFIHTSCHRYISCTKKWLHTLVYRNVTLCNFYFIFFSNNFVKNDRVS